MIDLFRINDYINFYRNEYPFLKIKFTYNHMGFYANLYIFDIVTNNANNWTFGVNDTEDALNKMDFF